MKKEKIKPSKKKILTYYLILAACLLVASAVTVGVVFGVKKPNGTIEKPPVNNPDDNNPDNPDDDKPDKPVDSTTSYVFIVPVKDVNLTQANVFCYDKTLDRYAVHKGIDFAAEAGTQVLAAVDGTIESIFKNDQLYGAVIRIKHDNGVETVYKFIEPAETLKVGDKVSRGDVIATVAKATGAENKEGDHLHFEVYENGTQIDPDEKLNIIDK